MLNDLGIAPGHSWHMAKAAKPGWYVKEWLKAKGLRQTDLIEGTGKTKGEISAWVSGARRFNADVLNAFSKVIGVSEADLLRPPDREALLVGKVGAGAEIVRFDHPDVLAGIPLPPGLDAPNVAEIEGDSQYPFLPGWLIFYGPENQGVPEGLVGKMCVVQVKDGPVLLKILKRGSKKGLWRLESSNAPPREDVKLGWAAMVLDIRPR